MLLFAFSLKSVSEVLTWSRHRKIVFFLSFTLLLSLHGNHFKEAKNAYAGTTDRCPEIPERLESIKEGKAFLFSTSSKEPALVQSNLIPMMVSRGNIHQWRDMNKSRTKEFKYFFTEKPPHGFTEYRSNAELNALLDRLRNTQNVKVIIDNDHVFLSEGLFSPD
jgi:hypothetical protein